MNNVSNQIICIYKNLVATGRTTEASQLRKKFILQSYFGVENAFENPAFDYAMLEERKEIIQESFKTAGLRDKSWEHEFSSIHSLISLKRKQTTSNYIHPNDLAKVRFGEKKIFARRYWAEDLYRILENFLTSNTWSEEDALTLFKHIRANSISTLPIAEGEISYTFFKEKYEDALEQLFDQIKEDGSERFFEDLICQSYLSLVFLNFYYDKKIDAQYYIMRLDDYIKKEKQLYWFFRFVKKKFLENN